MGWVFYVPDLFGETINVAILPISADSHARNYCLSIGAHFHYTCCGEILDTKSVLLVRSRFLSKGIASLPSRIPLQKTQLSSGIVFLSYSKYDGLAVFTFPRISPGLCNNCLQKSPQEQCLMLCKLFQLVKNSDFDRSNASSNTLRSVFGEQMHSISKVKLYNMDWKVQM